MCQISFQIPPGVLKGEVLAISPRQYWLHCGKQEDENLAQEQDKLLISR